MPREASRTGGSLPSELPFILQSSTQPPALQGLCLLVDIKKWVDEEYAGGRVTVLTDDEIIACLNRVCLEKNIKLGE